MIVGEERVPFYVVAGIVGFFPGAILGIAANALMLSLGRSWFLGRSPVPKLEQQSL